MKLVCIVGLLILSRGFTVYGENLDLDIARITADRIETIQQGGRKFIRATGNAYLLLNDGHFGGYSFASLETPILLSLDDGSVVCSGWFVAESENETFHFGVHAAKEPSIVFHANGNRSGRGDGVILIPGTPSADKKIAERKDLIKGARALIERHQTQAEHVADDKLPARTQSKAE